MNRCTKIRQEHSESLDFPNNINDPDNQLAAMTRRSSDVPLLLTDFYHCTCLKTLRENST